MTVRTRSELNGDADTALADNSTRDISAEDIRQRVKDLADSAKFAEDFSAFILTLLDDADAGAALTTLGVSAFVQTLLNDADASTARTTLGLVIGTNVQAYDADLASWAGVTRASGFDTFVATPSSANLRTLLSDETGTGIAYFVGGALGTPSSATLTNASGLPVSGITASTSTALGVGSVELGHATDTTLSRGAAGFLAVEGKRVPSPASQAAGDTLYRGSTEWERLALGTAGQVLTVNAGATAPEWQTASGGGGQPIPTSSTFAVGTLILAFNGSASSVASGGTLAGSDTRRLAVSSGTVGFGPAMTGTYTNYHGASVATNNCGYFARTA